MLETLNAGQTVTLQQGLDRPLRKGRGDKQGRWGSKAFEIFERLRSAGWITIIEDTGKVYTDGKPAPVVAEVFCGKTYYEEGVSVHSRGWHQTVTFKRSDKNPGTVAEKPVGKSRQKIGQFGTGASYAQTSDTGHKRQVNPFPNRWKWVRIEQAANLGDVTAQRILAERPKKEFVRYDTEYLTWDDKEEFKADCKAPDFTPTVLLPIPKSAIVVRCERSAVGCSTYNARGRHVGPKQEKSMTMPDYRCDDLSCRGVKNCKHVRRQWKASLAKLKKRLERQGGSLQVSNASAQTALGA